MIQMTLQTMRKLFFNPLFLIFVSPLTLILLGTVLSIQYSSITITSFLLLYLFVLLNQFLEKILAYHKKEKQKLRLLPIILFELLNVLSILYLTLSSNFLIGILLLLYSLVIHLQYIPYNLSLSLYSLILTTLFKGGILTYLSFYIQTGFISRELYFWSFPLIALYGFIGYYKQLLELNIESRYLAKKDFLTLNVLLLSIYIVPFLSLYVPHYIENWIFLLLLSSPLAITLILLLKEKKAAYSTSIKMKQINLFQIVFISLLSIIALIKVLSSN
ncbi:1,4-dihydroxy-2-naphthoate octaprenyltransferase [Carnobacterium divergens]|uniref:Prenyltransferase n=1 Tax=Carnobacterium divergens TaxID=2748 RepID=A0A7Z8G5F1_CARDV|nr:1,4-dihydroxy-2-naphthoate octaprenyltransferase [Carnobacterium divergens]MPQ21916.1 1,4-dihydroxy-2-naphthoate octaprenyltransferase [Carnobacterium divergens]TFI74936.1 hypothetical protein CKN58_02235 [Carnobacterium divergens]TFI79292.1 hypothetical protein CKN85_02235 [Carnobacterium divergens]TFI85619.1 hypothetical protein CKN56_02235 [Carnobacterium divergens]TFI98111.1 hypothetical protein CKN64_02235 [Carnobacterium divergens]